MKLYVIDTNVILLAGTMIKDVPFEQIDCYRKCIEFLNDIMAKQGYILVDDEGRVLKEYESHFRLIRYPNMADVFYRYAMSHLEYQHIVEKHENVYDYYPENEKLLLFDAPDRKFIAIAYGYVGDVPIVEATDSKWWGIQEELKVAGIDLIFVDEEYIQRKWMKKMSI